MSLKIDNRGRFSNWLKRLGGNADVNSGVARRNRLEKLGSRLSGGFPLPKTSAIPDIHGNHLALRVILDRLEKMRTARVFMGDYFDRGRSNLSVYRQLRNEDTILVGNHELYFLLAMRGDVESFIAWAANGGRAFLTNAASTLKYYGNCSLK